MAKSKGAQQKSKKIQNRGVASQSDQPGMKGAKKQTQSVKSLPKRQTPASTGVRGIA